MTNTIISINSLSKKYKIYDSPGKRLLEAFSPLRKIYHEELWALNDVSLNIHNGESVGIIGVNGSGKSTLLQIICGVLNSTHGSKFVNGKITALLELGTGFSMENPGRDNVFLQGAMMGLSPREMEEIYPSIEEFADIGGFIDRPVRTYSSGMLVRLAIAAAFQMKPDILIIDEVLAVGDIFFQAKCINKLQEMRQAGVTLLFVSHDMGTMRSLCDRTILLDKGRLVFDGNPSEAVETYNKMRAHQMGAVNLEKLPPVQKADDQPPPESKATLTAPEEPRVEDELETAPAAHNGITRENKRYGNGKGRLVSFTINGRVRCREISVDSGGVLDVTLEFEINELINNPAAGIMIRTVDGTQIFGNNTTFGNIPVDPAKPGERLKVNLSQHLYLNNGQYLMNLILAEWDEKGNMIFVDRHVNAVCIMVGNGPFPYMGICNFQGSITVEKL
jgi:ABC-type polysaccharide/polyol phosphate transport system ATPase subunit